MFTTALILLVLFVLSAVFSGTETAIFSFDRIRIKTLVAGGDKRAEIVERLRANPKRLLGTIVLCNNAVNVALSAIITAAAIDAFGSAWIGATTGLITFLLVIFSEFIPKSYAAHHGEPYALAVAAPIDALATILSPIVRVTEVIARVFVRMEDQDLLPQIQQEEIVAMAKLAANAGTVAHTEGKMVERVFLFKDITASDVMTPREEVTSLDGRKPLTDALPVIVKSKFSRFPVHAGDPHAVIGMVHIKDVFETMREIGDVVPRIEEVADTPMRVPATTPLDTLFRDFQRQHAHMAIVTGTGGAMVGVITVDDLLAELVGEIVDETDVDEHVIKRIDKRTIIVHGDAGLKTIRQFFNVRIPGPSNKTVSRLILQKTKTVPAIGTVIEVADGLTAVVERIAQQRIQRVRLMKIG